VLLTSKGFPVWLALLMSLTIYAGSGQFVAIELLTAPVNLAASAAVTLMVNARHLFYGLSLLDRLKHMGARKPYMIFSLTDETYSLLCSVRVPEGVDGGWFLFFISLLNHGYWILGGLIGALAGRFLTFDSTGIDFAMTALFIVIFVEQWENAMSHVPAVLGVAVTLLCLLLVGQDKFILAAMAGIFLLLTLLRGRLREKVVEKA